MNALHQAVLDALPGTMKDLSARTGVVGQPLWDAVKTLRTAGVIGRRGPAKQREFFKLERVILVPEGVSPGVAAAATEKEQRRQRKRPVVLFWIDGWPSQDPNRRMVWKVYHEGKRVAEKDFEHLRVALAHEANWEMASLSMHEVRKLRAKGYDLREVKERERELKRAAAAS